MASPHLSAGVRKALGVKSLWWQKKPSKAKKPRAAPRHATHARHQARSAMTAAQIQANFVGMQMALYAINRSRTHGLTKHKRSNYYK